MASFAENVDLPDDDTMSVETRAKVLAQSPLFQGLSATALADLAKRTNERRLAQGQTLFAAHQPADGMYIVSSGAVRAFRVNINGREQTIHVERAGGMLAEVVVFDEGPYPSNAVAEEDSTVLFLARNDVREFMLRHPETALTALNIMARKLRGVAALAEQLALMDVHQRLAALLLQEARQSSRRLEDGVSFSLPLSHAQLAARLGTVREVVTRTLQKLVHQGIIEIHGHRIVVRDMEALRAQG